MLKAKKKKGKHRDLSYFDKDTVAMAGSGKLQNSWFQVSSEQDLLKVVQSMKRLCVAKGLHKFFGGRGHHFNDIHAYLEWPQCAAEVT